MNVKTLLILLFFSPLALADVYFVENSKATGVADSDRAAVDQLIRSSVTGTGRDSVTEDRANAEFTLTPVLLKLGGAYVLTLEKRDKSNKVVYSQKMKAASMEDMDTVASRLTESVIRQTSTDDTADVTNITADEENRNTRRYKATRQWIIGLGPGWTENLRSGGGGFTFTLGYLWGLDPNFGVSLVGTFNSGPGGDDSRYIDFSLGGEYYFSRKKNTPFVGARFGYANADANDQCDLALFSNCKNDSASGWGTAFSAGYKFFRTSTVNVGLSANYFVLFDKTTEGTPSLTTVQFLIYY